MIKMNQSPTKSQSKNISFFSIVFGVLCIGFFLLFSALGIWQIQRLNWKTNLIASVNQRIHLPPIKAPSQNQWKQITFDKDEYRPVTLTGNLLTDKNIFVTALTQNTTGYWVLTPLQTADNTLTFINRGFIPMNARHHFEQEKTSPYPHSSTNTEKITITGFLRMSERDAIFPQKNNPNQNLWYTRQLSAMAQKLGLSNVAPYFIDATQKIATQGDLPIVGLTVVHFNNNHLSYALTWFILAAGVLSAFFFLLSKYNN
ncbi:SURF1 family protein [Bartonella bovis]|uniref:SURF1-like protein n=1 Tax=Bartonella bovis m02 TaxID=1094492 RepID=N6V8E6_9HYPH|nr:SURF1 family protein [Bartonella bovis]ENN90085.1 SurF1 family protein [Bartonella bovis m02]